MVLCHSLARAFHISKNNMLNYIIRRLLLTLAILLLVSFIVFNLLQLMPGNPAAAILGTEATKEQVEELEIEMGLDLPYMQRYGKWLWNISRGDFGFSYGSNEEVSSLIATRLPVTLYLSLFALLLAVFIGIPAGIICSIKRNSFLDQTISVLANTFVAVPVFWLGIMGIYLFGLTLNWLPIQGWTNPFDDFYMSAKQAVMPVILLGIPGIAMLTRQTRSSMLEVINQDYIRTARAKGMKENYIIIVHALKNAMMPVITLLGMHVRFLVGGSVLVETVFNIPGMGRLLVSAAFNRDIMLVQGGVLLIGGIVCLANLIVDVSYGWINPAVKYD